MDYRLLVGREGRVGLFEMSLDAHSEIAKEKRKPVQLRIEPELKHRGHQHLAVINDRRTSPVLGRIVKKLRDYVTQVFRETDTIIFYGPSRAVYGALYVGP